MTELGKSYQEMKKRIENLKPIEARVHRVLTDWQRTEHIPPERRLGPSLDNPQHAEHVFEVRPGEIKFGTRVPYSLAHAAHRMKSGRGSHMKMPAKVVEEVAQVIGAWVMRGQR